MGENWPIIKNLQDTNSRITYVEGKITNMCFCLVNILVALYSPLIWSQIPSHRRISGPSAFLHPPPFRVDFPSRIQLRVSFMCLFRFIHHKFSWVNTLNRKQFPSNLQAIWLVSVSPLFYLPLSPRRSGEAWSCTFASLFTLQQSCLITERQSACLSACAALSGHVSQG